MFVLGLIGGLLGVVLSIVTSLSGLYFEFTGSPNNLLAVGIINFIISGISLVIVVISNKAPRISATLLVLLSLSGVGMSGFYFIAPALLLFSAGIVGFFFRKPILEKA